MCLVGRCSERIHIGTHGNPDVCTSQTPSQACWGCHLGDTYVSRVDGPVCYLASFVHTSGLTPSLQVPSRGSNVTCDSSQSSRVGKRVLGQPQDAIKIFCILFTYCPSGGKGESHESRGSQALRTLGTGVEPSAQPRSWGRKREWGGGRPQPAESRRAQDLWRRRVIPKLEP